MPRPANTPPVLCKDCAHYLTGIYYEPVCYELTYMDGRKWARRRTPRNRACPKFQPRSQN